MDILDSINSLLCLLLFSSSFIIVGMNNGSYRIRPGGIFRGSIHENGGKGVSAFMLKDSMLRIEGNCLGIRVLSCDGNLWITQKNDAEDHVVMAGEAFALDRSGLAIVYSLSDANIEIVRLQKPLKQ